MDQDIRFTLRLPPKLHRELAKLAVAEHRSLNEQILYMLEQQLRRQRPGKKEE
jgi:hypothetical protein